MATLYSFTTTVTSGNYNWNANTDNYAWNFIPSATGIPNQLVLRLQGITGTPTADFFIRNQNTASGAITYGSATGITLTAGTNTITLTGGATITSGNTYYVWMGRTSTATNFPAIFSKNTTPLFTIFRSTAPNADPTTVWFNSDTSMDINGTLPTGGQGSLMMMGVGN